MSFLCNVLTFVLSSRTSVYARLTKDSSVKVMVVNRAMECHFFRRHAINVLASPAMNGANGRVLFKLLGKKIRPERRVRKVENQSSTRVWMIK